jgi:asparagine synthase (glutamine-hydrolysing)
MCGIAGIITTEPRKINVRQALLHMSEKLRHRGPDDEGFLAGDENGVECFGGKDTPAEIFESGLSFSPKQRLEQIAKDLSFGFSHRRLSIIDLSPSGHQPMRTESGKTWIIFNGEIYNYIELKKQLEELGHRFTTRSDTEVLLVAYKEWGMNCLHKLNGMWSFVLYDEEKKKIFGARDRFGVKPFYYYHDKNVFCFASEQKALVNQAFVKTGINEQALHDFLVYNEMEYAPSGLFQNILELFPGNYFELELQTLALKITNYYQLNVNTAFEKFDADTFKTHRNETQALVENAVRLRMRSDVKVGSCLSGGIDSSAIVGIMQSLLKKDEQPELFTAVFPGKDIDEAKWAKEVAGKGGNWNQTNPTAEELMTDLDDLVYSQDLPLWSSSTYAQHRVMRLAQGKGIKVLLDGQGGDELFAGYVPYFLSYWRELKLHSEKTQLKEEMKNFSLSGGAGKFKWKENVKGKIDASSLLFLKKIKDPQLKFLNRDFLEEYSKPPVIKREYNTLNEHLASEFQNTRLKLYLKCEDRCSMWHSVESRTPFADDIGLVEKIFSFPGSYKIKNGQLKYLLRESVKQYLPEKIYNRGDKMGYLTPHNSWMRSMNKNLRVEDFGSLKPYLNYSRLNSRFSEFFSPSDDTERFLPFKILTLNKWRSLFHI